MEYNNYYPSQLGHPPHPNQQHGNNGNGSPHIQQQQGRQMMHPPMPQQNTLQVMPPGQPNHHHQQQQHIQHQNYQQIHTSYGPSVSHSNSPHPQQQSHQHQQQHQHQHQHQQQNHQPNMTGPLPHQAIGAQHHVQSQSAHHHHHHAPVPPHMQPQQQLNQMVRPQMGPTVINHHHQSGPNQPPINHQQNFFGGSPGGGPGPVPHPGVHHYHRQNQHHHPHNQSNHQHIHHQPSLMHHGPSPISGQFPHHIQQGIGRNSPYFMNILQTEFRIIELNRRLQCRPLRYPNSPIPSHFDEHSLWWDRFALEFFEDDATLTLRLTLEEKPVEYTIGRALIPRFFRTYFDGGVTDLSINLRNPRETCIQPQLITLDCDQAFIVTNNLLKITGMPSNHGVVVHTEGHLNIDFVSNNYDSLSIKTWRFFTRRSHEYINRTILTTLGLPNNYLAEPITKQGLTKSTISYLKMCMIMEPMQELMYHHRLTKMDPRSCLRKLLFDRYKYRGGEDTRATTNKKRKRKPSAAPAINATTAAAATTTNKRSKAAGLNNSIGQNTVLSNNNNNNILMSPPAMSGNFSLASQDVMVVGEPSMMGGDFGDDNERMITRLENSQYDPSVSTPSIAEETTSIVAAMSSDNVDVAGGDHVNSNHTDAMSPPMIEQIQQRQAPQVDDQTALPTSTEQVAIAPTTEQPQQVNNSPVSQPLEHQPQVPQDQIEAPPQDQANNNMSQSPKLMSQQDISSATVQDSPEHDSDKGELVDTGSSTQSSTIFLSTHDNHNSQNSDITSPQEQQPSVKLESIQQQMQDQALATLCDTVDTVVPLISSQAIECDLSDQKLVSLHTEQNDVQHKTIMEEVKVNTLNQVKNESTMMIGVDLVNSSGNHDSLIGDLNDESNSNSQLACSTADNTPALEQKQPVDNGVA